MKTQIRTLGILYTLRRKQGLSPSVELQLPSEGQSALAIAQELELPIDKIEAVSGYNYMIQAINGIITEDSFDFIDGKFQLLGDCQRRLAL